MTYKYDVYITFKGGHFIVIESNSRNARKHLYEHNADKVYITLNGKEDVISYAAISEDCNILVYGASKRG